MKYILDPQTASSVSQLGGKASALAALQGLKLPIPEWVVVSPDAFYDSLSLLQAQSLGDADFAGLIATLQPHATVKQELRIALEKLCPNGELVAVRSSARDEDGKQYSFAGQLESFLNVKPEVVIDKVAQVWRSGFGDRLLAYRREHQLGNSHPPAVLIQRMVNAEFAGVAFSADPVTGQRGIVVVSAVRGLGNSLVSGDCNADTYSVDRNGKIIKRQLAEDHPEAILADSQVGAIAQLTRQVSHYFKRPQDIEWAIAENQVYLLQSRPITGLTQRFDPDGMLSLWDNSNIAESYSGVTTPLTFSFARRAYEEVYRQFCRMMGVPEKIIADHATTFKRMLGLIQGRVYYNLISWYRVLALLPGFTINRRFMEQMMGVQEGLPDEILAQFQTGNFGDRLQDGLRLGKTLLGLGFNYFILPYRIRQFYQRLNQALRPPKIPLADLRADELASYYGDLERQLLTRWDAPLINDFFAMIFYGILRKLTETWCNDAEGTLQNDLVSQEGGMISAEPAKRVKQLAKLAVQDASFTQQLCEGTVGEILLNLEQVSGFAVQYQAYLDQFGDRCLGELKLESQTLHDDPIPLLRSIGQLAKSYANSNLAETKFQDASGNNSSKLPAEARIQEVLASKPWQRLVFNWVLQNARARVRDRENLRFERTRLFGRVRRIFLEIGKRFYSLDILDTDRDIFYLEIEEVLGFINGTTSTTHLKKLVALRKEEFESYSLKETPSDRFETRGIVHQGNTFQSQPNSTATTTHIPHPATFKKGIGCCPGIVKAPVRVIQDPSNVVLETGSILVAERTDPGWIMLFPSAAGLLVERGSLLSHSAIVAREMGIPAIVSIADITTWLKDGDWVEMDGSTGIVRLIEPERNVSDINPIVLTETP